MRIIIVLAIISLGIIPNVYAQTDFPALKQQFLDYRKADKQDSALFIARKMNSLALQEKGDTSYWYALSMRYQGNPFYTQGAFDSTLFYWKNSVELFEKYHPNSSDYITSLNNLGVLYWKMADFKAAEPYYKKALEIRKQALGEEHPDYASSLNSIGVLYSDMGDFKSAEPLFQQALEILRKAFGEDHLAVARSLSSLGLLGYEIGDYKAAEARLKQALEIDRKALGEEHPDYASSLNNLGILYSDMGDYKAAEPYYNKALEIRKQALGEENPDYASSLNNLGALYWKMGDYKAAKPYYKKASEIIRKALGEEHPDYASSLNNLGILYSDMGDYKAAEPYYNKALEIRKQALGEEHPDYASSLNSLGVLYKNMGDFKSAEPLFQQALEIRRKALGEEHPDYARSLSSLGLLGYEIGDYKAAEARLKQALEIDRKALGEEHPDYARSLNNLGALYWKMDDYKAAEPYFKQVLAIRKQAFGEEHPDYASSLNNLGVFYMNMGDYKAAEPYYKQALEIYKKALGEEHPDYASSLNNLGALYWKMGDYKAAKPYYKKASEIIRKALGEEHPDYVSNENSYAYLLTETKREEQAFEILNKNFKKISEKIAGNFEWMTETQKEAYWKQELAFFQKLSWFASEAHHKIPESVALNYNSSLLTKSKLLEAKISKENYYEEIDEIREELSYRRKLLHKLESDGSDKIELIEKLRQEADSLDKQLELSWPAYFNQKRNLTITWDKVHQNLIEGEAAIEFVRFREHQDSAYQYQALIIRKDSVLPVLAPLCSESELLAITPNAGFSSYYGLVWEPLEMYLKDINTIYYAPVGELYNVPFHAIYTPNGTGDQQILVKGSKRGATFSEVETTSEENAAFLMDRYTLHQLTSTRYLALGLKKKETETLETSIAMVGGVNYDYLPGVQNAKVKKSRSTKKSNNRSSASASGKLAYLKGTEKEIKSIKGTLVPKNWETLSLNGNEAKEETLTKYTDKEAKGVLHIATHGYAFPEYSSLDTTIKENSLRYSYRFSQNPMVRSGLVLAGGNWAWTGSDTLEALGAKENGILTALEVSGLNLRNTKLVVLSACETGLGKIEGSEGTFGLKRGFKLAGVEQIIVSLWSVPDKETTELMTLFYEDLSITLNPVISFAKAQKEMRNKYPTRPDLWAGFVLVR